jgi:hypothetical protein
MAEEQIITGSAGARGSVGPLGRHGDTEALDGARAADSWRVRRERALLDADVRRLVDALRPFGVLRADQLARAAGASAWHEIVFERAIEEAVRRGLIVRLPEGFYADAERRRRHAHLQGAPGRRRSALGERWRRSPARR